MLGDRYAQHSFAAVPTVNKPRSKFDRSFSHYTTMDFDKLTPIYFEEVLPGDTYNVDLAMFARLQTQVVPLMDNAYIDFFYFFVPNRLVWSNWEKFMGQQTDPDDTIDYLIPITTSPASTGFTVGGTADHLRLPTGIAGLEVSALPFRAIQLIWNEWFRDQNLQDSIVVPKGDGPDNYTTQAYNTLLKRGKRHDRFTSCLPWAQKGDPVTLPLGTTAPVELTNPVGTAQSDFWSAIKITDGTTLTSQTSISVDSGGHLQSSPYGGTIGFSFGDNLQVNLTDATAATINALREAWMVQSLLELDARYGTRYVESIYGHFGVVSPDFRLQRPEYLGGGEVRIVSHPVPNTTDAGTEPQANLAAFATAATKDGRIGFSKSFVEHGMIIGFACARGELTYQQGIIDRFMLKRERYDFYFPVLAGIGEQPILNKEIYAQGTSADDGIFGYQEAWSDYRYKESSVTGEFRSTYSTPLDMWHLAEEFGSLPALNSTFIQSSTPIDRNITVSSSITKPLIMQSWHKNHVARIMPVRSIPVQIGRF